MANPFFSGRIPQELYEKAENHCKENKESKTDLLIKALSSYLNFPVEIQRQSYAQFQQGIAREEFEDLKARLIRLENITSFQDNMLNNSKESFDNSYDNKDNIQAQEKNNDLKIESTEENKIHNIIKVKELSDVVKIQPQEKINLKNQAFNKAQKKGYEIGENVKFNPPIEIIFKKGIFLEGEEYKLYCEGINENLKPEWRLELYDNSSYQLNIT
jgi:hypothetical protein